MAAYWRLNLHSVRAQMVKLVRAPLNLAAPDTQYNNAILDWQALRWLIWLQMLLPWQRQAPLKTTAHTIPLAAELWYVQKPRQCNDVVYYVALIIVGRVPRKRSFLVDTGLSGEAHIRLVELHQQHHHARVGEKFLYVDGIICCRRRPCPSPSRPSSRFVGGKPMILRKLLSQTRLCPLTRYPSKPL